MTPTDTRSSCSCDTGRWKGCKRGGPSPRKKRLWGTGEHWPPPHRTPTLLSHHSLHLMTSDNQGFLSWVPRFPGASAVQPWPGRTGYKIILSQAAKRPCSAFKTETYIFRKNRPQPAHRTGRCGHKVSRQEKMLLEGSAWGIHITLI